MVQMRQLVFLRRLHNTILGKWTLPKPDQKLVDYVYRRLPGLKEDYFEIDDVLETTTLVNRGGSGGDE